MYNLWDHNCKTPLRKLTLTSALAHTNSCLTTFLLISTNLRLLFALIYGWLFWGVTLCHLSLTSGRALGAFLMLVPLPCKPVQPNLTTQAWATIPFIFRTSSLLQAWLSRPFRPCVWLPVPLGGQWHMQPTLHHSLGKVLAWCRHFGNGGGDSSNVFCEHCGDQTRDLRSRVRYH